MSDAEINAYLEKEIINNAKTVTYRLLSRKLSIHVNAAKNALASFYTQRRENKQAIYATFWLSGEPQTQLTNGTADEMEVNSQESRDWLARKVTIVGGEDLERAKATFSKIYTFHVYSLSVSPLMSVSQLCGPSREVRELDKEGGDDFARSVGKAVSQQVKRGAQAQKSNKASVSTKPLTSTPSIRKLEPKETPKQKLKPSNSFVASEERKPKGTGTLSWAKAKTKDAGKQAPVTKTSNQTEEVRKEPPVGGDRKRGTKRKSDVMSQVHRREEQEESEEEIISKPEAKSANSIKTVAEDTSATARVKKGVVLSDDEDESMTAKASSSARGKFKITEESDAERSVRAMMDVDDSYVIKASKTPLAVSQEDEVEEPPATDHVDSAMDEDSDVPAPKAKPRKRKQKKNVPVGRNGLPKKRVVKSKTDFDEKGYMVTMDYSSYESVDEEEEMEDEKISKSKVKSATVKKPPMQKKADTSASESEAVGQTQKGGTTSGESKKMVAKKSFGKPSISKDRQTNSSQKSLANFFGPGNGKSKK